MLDYPVEFNSNSEAEKADNWELKTGEGLKTRMTVPEEFGGDNEYPSPEDLFAASIQTCMIATFKTIAERKNLRYQKIVCKGSVNLDRGSDSRPVMKDGDIKLTIEGIKNREKAEKVSKAAEKNCFIHNSVKTEIETSFEFTE